MKFIVLFCLLTLSEIAATQTTLCFQPVFQKKQIELNERIPLLDSNWMQFTTFKMYVSDVVCFQNGNAIRLSKRVHLLDWEDTNSLKISVPVVKMDSLHFYIGLDSAAHVSANFEDALDPALGMYWAWNTGYIHFKLQGFSSFSSLEDHSFEYHLGGYLPPFATRQFVSFKSNGAESNVMMPIDFSVFFKGISLYDLPRVMIPCSKAVEISRQLPQLFQYAD